MMSFEARRTMSDLRKNTNHLKNERGFTLIELLTASVLSVLMIALIAGVFSSQRETFVLQDQLNTMQTNGRAATEFLSRAVQNAGYNVFPGNPLPGRFRSLPDGGLRSGQQRGHRE